MTNGLVIVLGKTGRNFAAGMSGGIAYVMDELGEFAEFRCNKASVDLEQVFDPTDQQILHTTIYRHFDATGSPRAKLRCPRTGASCCRSSSKSSRTSSREC